MKDNKRPSFSKAIIFFDNFKLICMDKDRKSYVFDIADLLSKVIFDK